MRVLKLCFMPALAAVISAPTHGDAPAANATTNTVINAATNAAPAAVKPPPPPPDIFVPGTTTTPEGCTRENFYVHSPSMGRNVRACVLLPPEYASHPEKRYPILYGLHASHGAYDSFALMIPLRKELVGKPMILACFDADASSMYLDSTLLMRPERTYEPTTPVKSLFTTFFLKEFIPAVDKRYRVDAKKRMLTGCSMGGYGALHYMLAAPGEFIAVSSMSGYCRDWSLPPLHPFMADILGPYADNRQRYLDVDICTGIRKQLAAGRKLPPIYITIGTEDTLLEMNRDLHALLTGLNTPCEYHEDPGAHTWQYWRDHSGLVIDFHWSVLQQRK